MTVLTPPTSVAALRHGFVPDLAGLTTGADVTKPTAWANSSER